MAAIVFLLLFSECLVFLYVNSEKMPDEFRSMFIRLTNLIPAFAGTHSDLKSLIFWVVFLIFLILLVTAF